jgi:hypothetical protein
MRTKIVLTTFILAITLFTSLPVVALAQNNGAPPRQGALEARVAEILGIDQQELEAAFKQALTETAQVTLDARLQELVDSGKLTQQQASGLKAWLNSRPDVPMVPPDKLNEAIKNGTITQEQADALKAWQEARPDIPKIGPEPLREHIPQIRDNRDILLARVAEILGIDKQELVSAFQQARRELGERALDTRLQELVNQGAWTQEQADAYKAWVNARPDVPPLRPGPEFEQPE